MTRLSTKNSPTLKLLICSSLVSLLAACGTPDNGYYDANGKYNVSASPHNAKKSLAYPTSGKSNDEYYARTDDRTNQGNYSYERVGYYDQNGNFIDRQSGFNVPEDMFPPKGMCRVWFTQRSVAEQPAIESCNSIKSRVPAGAYVIFGG